MEIVYYPPCRMEGRRDELQSQRVTQDVEVPCVGTIPRKPRPQTRRDDTACVMGERQPNSCCLAAFVDKVTHALLVSLRDRPALVSPKWVLDAYLTLWRRAIGYVHSSIKTANGAYSVRQMCR